MATTTTQTQAPKDSGFSFKMLVRLSGLGAIAALFLPFFRQGEASHSAFSFFKGIVETVKAEGAAKLIEILNISPNHEGIIGLALGAFLTLVPVIFALTGLYMLIFGKYAGGPLTLLILILLAGWLGFMFGGPAIELEQSFFGLISFGFWIAVGALGLPFVGMFFLDKSV
ncbi:MAG: hypothetical protein H6581_09245 [Bacteroidia bacterium]|nr:hypothetical protein [Bacteroidia bacterium]